MLFNFAPLHFSCAEAYLNVFKTLNENKGLFCIKISPCNKQQTVKKVLYCTMKIWQFSCSWPVSQSTVGGLAVRDFLLELGLVWSQRTHLCTGTIDWPGSLSQWASPACVLYQNAGPALKHQACSL